MCINDLTLDQLLELNQFICQRVEEFWACRGPDVLSRLHLEQTELFETPESQVFGRVNKINRNTVVVQSEDNRQ
jgi:hypothetical protein